MENKKIVVYYTYTNNTKKIAEKIQKELDCDILEIKTKKQYSSNYDEVVELAKKEIKEEYTPELLSIDKDISKYDTIILGTPVWWYTFAPAIRTFLEENDLEGKTIIPFATNGGWIGHTIQDIEELCPKSNIEKGIDIRFTGNSLATSEVQINNWIENIK